MFDISKLMNLLEGQHIAYQDHLLDTSYATSRGNKVRLIVHIDDEVIYDDTLDDEINPELASDKMTLIEYNTETKDVSLQETAWHRSNNYSPISFINGTDKPFEYIGKL